MTSTLNAHREGKSKILEPDTQAGQFRVTFKDAATAFNGKKFSEIPGKGQLNATISSHLFALLEHYGIETCFVGKGPAPNQLVYRELEMIPLEVVVRNIALGSLCKRFNLNQGEPLKAPLIEFFLKDDAANDPQITDEMIDELGTLPQGVCLTRMKELSFKINELFFQYFDQANVVCADFKLEFGVDKQGHLVVGDELSPDNFRLRDKQTGEVLDKDVFRLELAELVPTYEKLLARIQGITPESLRFTQLKTYQATVNVSSRKNVLSPESKAILESVKVMGYTTVASLTAGKHFELTLTALTQVEAEKALASLSESLLANPVIEDFQWSIRYVGKAGV